MTETQKRRLGFYWKEQLNKCNKSTAKYKDKIE